MKRNRRLMNIVFVCFSVLLITLTLSVVFSRLSNTPQQGGNVHMEYSVNDSDIFDYEFIEVNNVKNKYDEKYAKIIGFNTSVLPSKITSFDPDTDYISLTFPSSVSHSGADYKVMEIDIPVTVSSGYYETRFVSDSVALDTSLGFDILSAIQKIQVPKTVQYISHGAFNQFKALTDVELPFIGTRRLQSRTVDDAFLAIFGSKNYKVGGNTASFDSMRLTSLGGSYIQTPSGENLTNVTDYTNWYNYNIEKADADPTENHTIQNTHKLAYPQNLKNIVITDEYSIDNHAFFYIPNVESIAVQFSEDLRDVGTDYTNGATVGLSAFANCYWLKTVALPSNTSSDTTNAISSLSDGVFRQCESLHTVTNFIDYEANGFAEYAVEDQKVVIPNTTPFVDNSENTSKIPRAFMYGCKSVKWIVLPTDVTRIEAHAFDNCKSLEILDFKNNTYNIEKGLCRIPDYIQSIGEFAFANCGQIKTLIVSNNVLEIEEGAFSMMNALTSVTLPFIGRYSGSMGDEGLFGYIFGIYASSATSGFIEQSPTGDPSDPDKKRYAVSESIINVTITNEIYVNSGAFMNCKYIQSLQINDPTPEDEVSTMFIGHAALAGCSGIISLSIPFVGPYDLTNYDLAYVNEANVIPMKSYPAGTKASDYRLGWIFGSYDYSYSGMVATDQLSDKDFYISPNLANVALTRQSILITNSFYGIKTLKSVSVEEYTKYSQKWIFGENPILESVSLPFVGACRGYKYWSWYYGHGSLHNNYSDFADTFAYFFRYNGTYNLPDSNETSVDCPFDQIYYFGRYWYDRFKATIPKSLSSITITEETYFTSLSFRALDFVTDIRIEQTDPNKIRDMVFEANCLMYCTRLETLTLPFIGRDWNPTSKDNFNYTMGYLFGYGTSGYQTTQYQKVSFPSSLKRIEIGADINYISVYAFAGMKNLASFSTESRITAMGAYCFANCPSLEEVKMINATYTRIPSYAFYNDILLYDVTKFAPATVKVIGAYALSGTSVSSVDFSAYDSIEKGAFSNCLQITSVDFTQPDFNINLVIGDYIFADCVNLTNVKLRNGYVSKYMFKNCVSLKGLVYDGAAEYIPEGMFYGCASLQSQYYDAGGNPQGLVLTPDSCGVKTIGAYAFYGCTSLTDFVLPTVLETIGEGAFQNCKGLKMLTIPKSVKNMPYGTYNGVDQTDSGAFYGCDDQFYFEVFYNEADWPHGWLTNWNCYFPVKTIGASTENMFTYAYSPVLKGYLISGLNVYDPVLNPIGYKFVVDNSLVVKDTLVLPEKYNGVNVYGLAAECFISTDEYNYVTSIDGTFYHYLENVEKFVLGSNYIYLGENSLIFDADSNNSIFREIYIPTTSNAAKTSKVYSSGDLIYETEAEKEIKAVYQSNMKASLNYGEELYYVENAIVYYGEAWQYVGNNITWKTSALEFKLIADSFTYALGKAIKPEIIGVSTNANYVKYAGGSAGMFAANGQDRIINAFYPSGSSAGVDLKPVRISYSSNINVGTGKVSISPVDSRFTGSTTVYFTISKYKIDLGYESTTDKAAFGVDGTDNRELSALDHFVNIMLYDEMKNYAYNQANFSNLRTVTILDKEYDGKTYKISNWHNGRNIFLPSSKYIFSGVLETSAVDSGFYVFDSNRNTDVRLQILYNPYSPIASQYKNRVLNSSGETINYAVGGFKWATTPRLYDENGNDVSANFNFNVTLAVYIKPYTVKDTSLSWPGSTYVLTDGEFGANYYEYPYTGAVIEPMPVIQDPDTYVKYDAKFKVSVTPKDPVYPSTYTGVEYFAQVTGYDSRNFRIPNEYLAIRFVVVKANLVINLNIPEYLIGETQEQVVFDFNDVAAFDQDYELTFENLHGHILSGKLITVNSNGYNWTEGLYTYGDPDFNFTWDLVNIAGNGYKIHNADGMDCTEFFNITYNVKIKIIYNTFDYNLTVNNFDVFKGVYKTYPITGINEAIGVIDYSETSTTIDITFGADGYEHTIDADVHNVQHKNALTKIFNYEGIDADNFKFTNLKEDGYIVNLRLEKTRYYTVAKTIRIKVIKSDYVLLDISKEYDREPVDVLDADRPGLARLPIDFDPSKVEITYYKTSNKSEAIAAPSAIGEYIFKIVTDENHSAWFNDLISTAFTTSNSKMFEITQRSIYIDVVDKEAPFDSKYYDGEPWKLILSENTETKFNLLPGDSLTGYFVSRSSEIGIYDASIPGMFVSTTPWKVTNLSLDEKDQTSNYKIVYRGIYEIKPLVISYTSSSVTATYESENPQYYSINLNVTDPLYGYTIYYSLVELPADEEWETTNKPYFISPGIYSIYFKIVAPHYETVLGQEAVTINAATMDFGCSFTQTYNYDGFPHYLDIKLLNDIPSYATIYYASVSQGDYGNLSSEAIENLHYTTNAPSRTELGNSYFYVRVEARNFEPISGMFTLKIENQGIGQGTQVKSFAGDYDTNAYGPIIDFSSSVSGVTPADTKVYYYVGDSFNDSNVVWNEIDLWQADYGNSYDGQWILPLMSEATDAPIKVSVRTLVKGFSVNEQVVTVHIKKLVLDLGIHNYSGIFDNKYHAVLLTKGSSCYDLIVDDKLNDDGTISYIYYFTSSLFVELTVRYHTSYNPMIGTAGFTTKVVKEKNVCDKAVYMEVSAQNCENLFFNNGRITIRKNEDPFSTTIFDDEQEIEYLARNIKYSDLGIVTPHDATPIIKWTMRSTGVEVSGIKDLGEYHVRIIYPDNTNCAGMQLDIDVDIVTRKVVLDYEKEVEYDGYIENYPYISLVTQSPCDDSALLTDLDNIIENYLLIYKIGTYPSDYKDIYAGYQLQVEIDSTIQEYELVGDIVTYDIVRRKLYITFEIDVEYTGDYWKMDLDQANGSTGDLIDIPNGTVKQLLTGHRVQLHFETANFRRGAYVTNGVLSPNIHGKYSKTAGTGIVKVSGQIIDNVTGDILELYDLVLDIKVNIVFKELEVEVENKTIPFDNAEHGLDIVVKSSGVISYSVVYWFEENPDYTFTSFMAKDVGVYNLCYRVSPDDEETYKPYEGKAVLTIEKAYLSIEIDPLDKIYDGNKHNVTHTITNSGFVQFTSPQSKTYYFNLKMLEEKRVTKDMLDNLFDNLEKYQTEGVPKSEKELYQLYQTALTSVENAGDYYAYVYYPNTHNYYASYGSKLVTLQRRALYFINKTPNNPLQLSKIYDTMPLYAALTGFIYDDTATSENNTLPNTGLIKNGSNYLHDFADRSFAGYEFMTASANCKLDQFGDEVPYTSVVINDDGTYSYVEYPEFLFAPTTVIKKASSKENLYDNYYPVFKVDKYTTSTGAEHVNASVQLLILRAELDIFDVSDLIGDKAIQFNGKDALPEIETPSDGKLIYFYQKVYFDDFGVKQYYGTPQVFENQKEITQWIATNPYCYYEVFVSIDRGTNYHAWNGDSVATPVNKPAKFDGYNYKSAFVEVIPADVTIDWGELEVVYDGGNNVLTPRFVDVATGNYRYIGYDVQDYEGNYITSREMITAGTYSLSARLSSITSATGFDSKNYKFLNPNVNFDIKAKHYTIEVKEDTDYLFTAWTKNFTEADFETYIIPDDPLESWLYGHTLYVNLKTNPEIAGRFNNQSQFILDYKYLNANGDDVSDSITFTLKADVLLRDGSIRYETKFIETDYDNQYHQAHVKVISHLNGYSIKYFHFEMQQDATGEWVVPHDFEVDKIPWSSASISAPKFKDVGYYRVYFQIMVNGKNTEIGYTDVYIKQAQSFILFGELGLDRVYTGAQIGAAALTSNIKGGFNGDSAQLVYTWYNPESADPNTPLPSEPYEVGTYRVVVTSNGDGNSAIIQNYTELNEEYTFTITKAPLTLVINSDLVITHPDKLNDANVISTWNKNNKHRNEVAELDKESTLYGLKGSDYLEYQLELIDVNGFNIKLYEYFDKARMFDSATAETFLSDAFQLYWVAKKDTSTGSTDISYNYDLYLNFKLNVHYPNAKTKTQDKAFDYDGNAKHFYDGTNAPLDTSNNLMIIEYPNVSTLIHGIHYSVYYKTSKTQDAEWILVNGPDDIGFTNPGDYVVYYKVEFNEGEGQYYTTATGSVELKINFRQRECDIAIEGGELVYNGEYRGKNHTDLSGKTILDYIDVIIHVGDSPNKLSWGVKFYEAMKVSTYGARSTETYIKTGLPFDEIIDSGDYIVEVTIPESTYFAETVLYVYLPYTRRVINVVPKVPGTSISMVYNGSNWRYNLARDEKNYFSINNIVPGHVLSAATITCDAINEGVYDNPGIFGFEVNKPGDYTILDSTGKDVTNNYTYVIKDLTLVIEKAEVTIKITPFDALYDYPGEDAYITPSAILLNPVGYNHMLQYSLDGLTWQNTPYSFRDVGTYGLYVKSTGIQNYKDKLVYYPFEITMKGNDIVFQPLDKIYDAQAVTYPTITTKDGYFGLADPNVLVGSSNIVVTWSYYDSSGIPHQLPDGQRPVDVGKYNVRVHYPDTDNYYSTEDGMDFEISPLEIGVNIGDKSRLEYNTLAQAPTFDIFVAATGVNISYLSPGTDYQILYFEKNNTNVYNNVDGTTSKPVNVGSYVMRITLTGDAADNVKFNVASNAIEKDIYFEIVPRKVRVEYNSILPSATSIVVVQPEDLILTNFPNTVTFASSVQTASSVTKAYYYQGTYSQEKWDEKGLLVWGTPHNGGPALQLSSGLFDDLSNYEMYVDISITITNGGIPYTVNAYNGVYDGEYHSFHFEIQLNPNDYDWVVEYSLNKVDWSLTKPTYKDAMTSPVHVFVRVMVYVGGTTTPSQYTPTGPIILCETTADALYSEFEVMIERAETEFSLDNIDLNRVYDGTATRNPIVNYNFFGTDDRDDELNFSYYMKVVEYDASGNPIVNYQLIAREDVINAGDYRLIVSMNGSKNYKASVLPIEVDFTISKRVLYVKVEGDKVYDGIELSFDIDNSNLVVPDSSLNSGIVSGHEISGIILTNSANCGEYTNHSHFKWHEEYTIEDSRGMSVISNYDVVIYGFAKINKASFDFTAYDGEGVYINDSTFYYIDIQFNTTPKVSTNVMEDLIFYTDNPNQDLSDPASYTSLENIGVCKGTKTIYFMIQAENYTTVFGSAQVKVTASDTKLIITSWPGMVDKLYYTGLPYDYSLIEYTIEGGEDYGRTASWKFYDEDKNELPEGVIPTNGGKYYFKGFVSETYDNAYGPAESDYIPFVIHSNELTITWEADIIKYDSLGNPIYIMYYTGDVVTPTPIATDVFGNPIEFTVTVTSGDGIIVGSHACKAEITDPEIAKNYLLTFVGSKDSVNYTIKASGPIPMPPTDPTDPDFPKYLDDTIFTPGCNYILSRIVFPSPQGNPYDSNNPYTYGDEYVVKAIGMYVCIDCSSNTVNHELIFQMDKLTGEIISINGVAVGAQSFTITIDYDAPLKTSIDSTTYDEYHYHEAIAKLKDTTNQSWDINNPTAKYAMTAQIKVDLDEILAEDIEVIYSYTDPDTGVVTSPITDFKFKYTGREITFDVKVNIIKRDSAGTETKIELEPYQEPTSTGSVGTGDYVVLWFNNVNVTDGGASLSIMSLPASGYNFTLGSLDEYDPPTLHYQQFSIYKELPSYIQLTDTTFTPHTLNIQKVEQNYNVSAGVNEIIMTPISYDDRVVIIDPDENPAGKPANVKFIIDGFYPNDTLSKVLALLKNPIDRITIQENNKVIFDGSISSTNTLDPDTGAESIPIDEYLIKTGLLISLFPSKEDRVNTSDSIELILYGDVDKDGYIGVSDITAIAEWLVPGSPTKPEYNDIMSIAGLISFRKGETTTTTLGVADITGLAGYLEIGKNSTDPAVQEQYDFNYQYKPADSSDGS